jgi:hypothetical protein
MTGPPPEFTELLELSLTNIRQALLKLDAMAGIIASFAPDYNTTVQATRTFGYRGGRYWNDAGVPTFEPDGTIVCTDDATVYVQADPVNGVTLQTTPNPLRRMIAQVISADGLITHINDLRDADLNTPNRVRWRGAWASGSYLRNDAVSHLGALWIANTTTTTEEPGTDPEWTLKVFGVPDPTTGDPGDIPVVAAGGDEYELLPPGSIPGIINTGGSPGQYLDIHPATADAMDDEFEDAVDQSGPINSLDAKWSWFNQGGASVAFLDNMAEFTGPASGGSNLRGITQPIPTPSGDYRFRASLASNMIASSASAIVLLVLRESGTNKFLTIGIELASVAKRIITWRFNGVSSPTAINSTGLTNDAWFGRYLVFEVERSGSTLNLRYFSPEGGAGILQLSESLTTSFTTEPDEVGLAVVNSGAASMVAESKWFRKVA